MRYLRAVCFGVIGLLIFSVLGLGFVIENKTSALTYQTQIPVQFSFEPELSINLSSSDLIISNLTPGDSGDSNIITVGVSTNALYGYTLSATVGTKTGASTALANTSNSNYKFNNLSNSVSSLANIPDNNWGYSYSSDNGTTWVSGNTGSASAGYAGLPLDNNTNADERGKGGVLLINNDGTSNTNSVKFKIGAKASSTQPSGEYTNVINFYAVTNPEPMTLYNAYRAANKPLYNGYYALQDLTFQVCGNAEVIGDSSKMQAIDTRDGSIYWVTKLADGNCWLLDNLTLDLTNPAVLSGLSEDNTNASNTTLNYLKNGGGDTDDQYATSGVSNWVDGYSYSDPLVNMDSKEIVPSDSASTAGAWKIGGYYNYCAATAGSYCYGDGESYETSSDDATEDICPAGWKIPADQYDEGYANLIYSMFDDVDISSDPTASASFRSALRLPLSGFFIEGSIYYQNSDGSWWSSSPGSDSDILALGADTSIIYTTNSEDRSHGTSIRCMAES